MKTLLLILAFALPCTGQFLINPYSFTGGGAPGGLFAETFDAAGYDATWAETGSGTINEDDASPTHDSSAESLEVVCPISSGVESYTVHDLGSGYDNLDITLFMWVTSWTIPTNLGVVRILNLRDSADTTAASISLRYLSGSSNVALFVESGAGSGASPYDLPLGEWIQIDIAFRRNATTTFTFNSSVWTDVVVSMTADDKNIRYIRLGTDFQLGTDEATNINYDSLTISEP